MATEFILVDGYNVLHSCGFIRGGVGPGTLRRARNVFFGLLHRSLDPEQQRRTTIVFDSSRDRNEDSINVGEIRIEFATKFENADQLIELLIKKHSAPKQLLVVSSDHWIQQAARRRGARSIDSDQWLEGLISLSTLGPTQESAPQEMRDRRLNKQEVEGWLRELGINEDDVQLMEQRFLDQFRSDKKNKKPDRLENANKKVDDTGTESDIFPPDYADDLFDDWM